MRRWEGLANRPWDPGAAAELDDELRRFLQGSLPEYMVPSAIVPLDRMPVNKNGKLDRPLLDAMVPGRASAREFVAPRTELEHRIANAWRAVLGSDRVSVEDTFFELGGDSVQSIQLVSRINRMGYHLPVAALFQHPTVAGLARQIEAGRAEAGPAPAGERGRYAVAELSDRRLCALAAARPDVTHVYPLSPLQDHMLRRMLTRPEPGLYVVHGVTLLREAVDVEGCRRALDAMVELCPLFRTSFDWSDPERPVQLVHRSVRSTVEVEDWSDLGEDEQAALLADRCAADRERGFRLDAPDPPRMRYVRRGEGDWMELMTAHYMRIDGWSSGELSKRMRTVYEEALAGVETTREAEDFGPYADWLRRRGGDRERRYWTTVPTELRDRPAPLPEPPRPGPGRFQRRGFTLDQERSERLRMAARARGVTLNAIWQAAWAVVLGAATGRRDVLFGVAMSGRPAEVPGIERMIGPFLNFLPFALHLAPDMTASELLRALHSRMLDLVDHQWTSLSAIADWWSTPAGRPMFDSYFVFQNLPGVRWSRTQGYNLSQTEVPLRVEVTARDELQVSMQFADSRLDAADVEGWLARLGAAADALATAAAEITVAEIRRRVERAVPL
ncbi:MAG TPA: condensation domain-containing protein [Candidatus Dormibacteraeota bacterium]|nr:condensation domain-containing protein [Candidatus Dormibacteraeota bacterium]